MKVRSGFVSNSSSSSFVVVGKKLSAEDLEGRGFSDFHSPGAPWHFMGTGKELSTGIDMFTVTEGMFETVKALVTMGESFDLYAASLVKCTETEDADIPPGMMTILEGMLVPEHRAEVHKYELSADNNSSMSMFDFMWRYHRVASDDEDMDDWGNDWEYLSEKAHGWLDTYTKLKEL